MVWMVELLHVPHRLFGESMEVVWPRLWFRTLILICIWVTVHITTSRLLRRLHELEGFLLICSWCRKVGDKHDWLSMEDYFSSRFSTDTTHGICPACSKRQLDQHRTVTCTKAEPPPSA